MVAIYNIAQGRHVRMNGRLFIYLQFSLYAALYTDTASSSRYSLLFSRIMLYAVTPMPTVKIPRCNAWLKVPICGSKNGVTP